MLLKPPACIRCLPCHVFETRLALEEILNSSQPPLEVCRLSRQDSRFLLSTWDQAISTANMYGNWIYYGYNQLTDSKVVHKLHTTTWIHSLFASGPIRSKERIGD